jgi:hypothetical protein
MDVLLGIIEAVSEGTEFIEALQVGEAGAIFVEGIQAAAAANEVRQTYKQYKQVQSSLSSSTSSTSSSLSSSSLSSRTTSRTVEVTWTDKSFNESIGVSNVPEKYLIKCHPSELFLMEDVVQATCDLTYGSGEKIPSKTYGILKGYDKKGYLIVHWLVDGMGELPGTPHAYLKKCDQSKFFKVGDVVQALFDLRYGGNDHMFVPKGTNGTLKELEDSGTAWTVDWWNGITEVSTKQEYMRKCDQSKFLKVGEVVKARFDLTWPTGEAVPAGTFGTLTLGDMESNNWDVKWWNDVGELGVSHVQIQKCHHTEYSLPDDLYRTSCDLKFGTLGSVPKGSLCKRVFHSEKIAL